MRQLCEAHLEELHALRDAMGRAGRSEAHRRLAAIYRDEYDALLAAEEGVVVDLDAARRRLRGGGERDPREPDGSGRMGT
jgi:hypothetical protein